MATSDTFAEQARQFAQRLTDTVKSVAPDCDPFHARAISSNGRIRVQQAPSTGVPLKVDQVPILRLTTSYDCALDGEQRYLAVDKSQAAVYAGDTAKGEPLFRYEYIRKVQSDIPSAHLQVHAHRDAITYVMGRAGSGTRRGQDRRNNMNVPHLAELHFPLGGHRFRPCLEDILEMLITELGVDCPSGGREALRTGREDWRRRQTRAAVRDAPDVAIGVLQELGYEMQVSDGHKTPSGHRERLRDF